MEPHPRRAVLSDNHIMALNSKLGSSIASCAMLCNRQCIKYKNQMKGDIGMANYEKQVEQEAAYPIPISLYNCYRTVRHEKRYQEYIAMPFFSCLTVM